VLGVPETGLVGISISVPVGMVMAPVGYTVNSMQRKLGNTHDTMFPMP
jgi:hypothetical protein